MSNLLDTFMTINVPNGFEMIDKLSGTEFEEFCAELLRAEEYTNIQITQGSGDHGVDITADKSGMSYAIQCKRYSGNVGNTAIQEIFSGKAIYHKDKALVITNSEFTAQAMKDAISLEVELWNRAVLIRKIEKYKDARLQKEAAKRKQEEIKRQKERELEAQSKREEQRKREAAEAESRRKKQYANGIVYLADVFLKPLYDRDNSLRLVIGMDHNGTSLITSLTKAPHVLVAGANIESIFNCFITSLLIGSKDFRLILLGNYPNYGDYSISPIIEYKRSIPEALGTIKWLEDVIEKRKLQKPYNSDANTSIPYIICIIDEISNLVAADPQIVESLIKVLNCGAEYGIHIILGTQIPNEYALPRRLRDLIPVRICRYGLDQSQFKLIIENDDSDKLNNLNECYFMSKENRLFRTVIPTISPCDIQKAVDCATKDFKDIINNQKDTAIQAGCTNTQLKKANSLTDKIKHIITRIFN